MNTRTIQPHKTFCLLCLLLLQTSVLSQQQAASSSFPNSNPMQDSREVRDAWRKAYKNFKPPAEVAAAIAKAMERQRDAFHAWGAGELPQAALTVENERAYIHRHLLLCLALCRPAEVPDLVVVLANSREVMKVFPSGKLPADSLVPNTVYETGPGRKVRYLTLFQWSNGGPKFAVFAREGSRD